jgi:hypothetical protein
MPAKVIGDYSQYPASIRDALPHIEGAVCELRNCWQMYHILFMDNEQKTNFFGERFGPLLGVLQSLLENEMILSISRLTDKDSKSQSNLSLWSLAEAIPFANDKGFGIKVNSALDAICTGVSNARKHRHKQIAHFAKDVSLGISQLQTVFFSELKLALEQMEEFINLFHWEFAKTTLLIQASSVDFIEPALVTACKAKAYDELEASQLIAFNEWQRRLEKWPYWNR